jgi:glycine hydroxymethyltransferase
VVADRLEACHIIAGAAGIPEELGRHGLRIGVQEVTRYGMTEADAPEIADCIVDVLNQRDLEGVKDRAIALGRRFKRVRFTIYIGLDDQ